MRRLPARALALVVMLLLVAGAAGWLLRPGGAASDRRPGGPTVLAVLPFTNLGPPADEYFADGISDALRGKLAGIEGLTVIASSSTRPYKGTAKTPRQIGEELGVGYLLTGTVRWAKGPDGSSRVQVSPELIAAGSGTTRWQQPFDAVLSDVFAVQGEIAARVAEALSVTLLEPDRRALSDRPTGSLEAYDAYLRASALLQQAELGAATQRLAAEGFRRAVELDPEFALAWARLAYAHMGAYWFSEDRTEYRLRLARGAADTALALGPELPEAWLADGYYWYWGWRAYDRALAAFERAHGLSGGGADAEQAIGNALRRKGRVPEAAEHYRRALALDPRDAALHRELALTLIATGELDEADRLSARSTALAPDAIGNYLFRMHVLFAREDVAGADETLRDGLRVIGTERFAHGLVERWNQWQVFSDSTTWRVLEHLPLTPQVADTGGFHLLHAEWLHVKGRTAEAAAVADSAVPFLDRRAREAGDDWWARGYLALAHALAGRQDLAALESRRSLATLERAPDAWDRLYAEYHAAKVAVAAGDLGAAIAHLAEALKPPSPIPPAAIRVDERFAALRGDPHYEALVRPR